MSNAFICIMGMGTVFFGLVCIVFLCYLMSMVCKKIGIKDAEQPTVQQVHTPQNNAPIENKQEIIAGVCAVIAEELGTDVKNIQVLSFKRV